MKSSKLFSFFDTFEHGTSQENIWEQFDQYRYQQDIIEHEFNGHLINEKTKPINLHIGQETMYYLINRQVKGILPLNFTKMTTYHVGEELVIRFVRNTLYTDVIVQDAQKFQETLANKCILATFHDDYQVESALGKGGFAHVYLAKKISTGQKFAVKAFNKQYVAGCCNGKESLENEIRVMKRLKSELLVQLYEVHETQHSIYLVMKLMEGGQLSTRSRSGVYKGATLQILIYNLLRAISHMHQKKCMHRDIKPQNILLKKDSDVDIAIADFGFASFFNQKPIFKRCGTPGYIAPEILRIKSGDQLYNEKCDIFSLGVIFYELGTGKYLFGDGNAKEILQKNKDCIIKYDFKQEVSNYLKDLMQKMLEENPQKRLSAEECLTHPYFKELQAKEQKNSETNQNLFILLQNFNDMPFQSLDSQKGSQQLVTKHQQQFNGNIDSFGSLSDSSPKKSQHTQQLNLSKFTAFQAAMEVFQKDCSPTHKKSTQDSLRKVAMKNSYYQKMKSRDDYVLPEVTQNQDNPEKLKKQNSHEV